MMRVLLDTNVVLDVLLQRVPWVTEASAIWRANDEGRVICYVMASALTDIFYVARRISGLETARTAVKVCLEAFEFCPVDRNALKQASLLPGNDFEDNLQIVCADIAGLDAIVTRNPDDFKTATTPVLTPVEALETMIK